jgi:peptidoglycan/xylan/chitin deacetylase (PgdA/CDA1 family)
MYFYASFTKILVFAAIASVLAAVLYVTLEAKRYYTGSTPHFYSFVVFPRYLLTMGVAEIERAGRHALSNLGLSGANAAQSAERPARAVAALAYHRILEDDNASDVTVARFRDQMETLKNAGWHAVTLEEFKAFLKGEQELPERSFLMTFDDGTKDSFYPVDPVLRALDYSAATFVIVHSSDTRGTTYYLTPEEIRFLQSTGRWSIGSHSFDGHRPHTVDAEGTEGLFFADRLYLPKESRNETPEEFQARVIKDLNLSKEELERRYGIVADTFAFPLGNETGIEGVANFPEGPSITLEEAEKVYSLGLLQTNGQVFSFNYPDPDAFIGWRIHVDHDWDGDRLLHELESGLPKDLPFEDDFSTDRGWLPSWGALGLGRNNLTLAATEERTSASTILDGTKLWDSYAFNAALDWQTGSAFLLADVVDSHTYRTCAFSPGKAEIQSTTNGETRVLAQVEDPRIAYGENVRAGVRVRASTIECTWEYESIVEAYERDGTGGIGIQVWNEEPGTAALRVSSISVQPF